MSFPARFSERLSATISSSLSVSGVTIIDLWRYLAHFWYLRSYSWPRFGSWNGASGEIKVLRLSNMPALNDMTAKRPAGIATWHLDAVPCFPPSLLECRQRTRIWASRSPRNNWKIVRKLPLGQLLLLSLSETKGVIVNLVSCYLKDVT